MEAHEIEVRFKLPGRSGKDLIASDKTPELLAKQWAKKMQKKEPHYGWKLIKGHMSGEVRTTAEEINGEFWVVFKYA